MYREFVQSHEVTFWEDFSVKSLIEICFLAGEFIFALALALASTSSMYWMYSSSEGWKKKKKYIRM